MSIEDIATINVTASSPGPTAAGFGVPLIPACNVPWASVSSDRSRAYSGPEGMAADGFLTTDAAYRAANSVFSQTPRVAKVKIGRRALPFSQVLDLTPETPAAGKVYGVTLNTHVAAYTALGGDNLAAVCTALAAALNAVNDASPTAIASGGSTAGIQTLTGGSLNGAVGGTAMSPPRSLAFVFSNHTDWDATTIVVTGTDAAGRTITENFVVPNNGNATVTGVKLFRTVTQISIPAQTGVGGTFTLGTRARFTASGVSGTKVVVTTTDAGVLTSLEDMGATLSLKDQTTDPGIATDLAAIRTADKDWYGLLLDSNSQAEVAAAAAWAEANGVLLVAQSADSACLDGASTTDVAYVLKAANYGRTTAWFHPAIGTLTSWLAAGLMGNRLPKNPGSDTWSYKTPAGVAVYALTETQKANLFAKNAGTFTAIAGVNVTEQGKVAGGEWVDVVRFLDWLRARLRERMFGLVVRAEKLAYTDASIDIVRGEVRAQLNEGASPSFGGIDGAQPILVTAPKVADIATADRQARKLPGVNFTARLAGAIHLFVVNGTVSP